VRPRWKVTFQAFHHGDFLAQHLDRHSRRIATLEREAGSDSGSRRFADAASAAVFWRECKFRNPIATCALTFIRAGLWGAPGRAMPRFPSGRKHATI
jgi:hypothetical protein